MKRGKYHVRLLQIAEDDLADIVSFIAIDDSVAAEALINRIEQNLAHLEAHPFPGRIPNDEELADLGYRYLVVANYLMFYTIHSRNILIHRIIHGARDYKNLL